MTPLALDAHNPGPMTGTGNHTWSIPGRVPALVDAGTGDPRHLAAVEQAFAASSGPSVVLITHAHGDHMSGAPALAERFPRARFAKMPWPERDRRYPVPFDPLVDGARIEAGDEALEVLHTPGHSPDHVCLWHEESRSLFCGDLMIDGRTVVIPASHGGSLADYQRSLERIVALDPRRAYPAHGPVIESPVDLARMYLQHRARRERQVVEALSGGTGSPAEIAARIYQSLPDELRGMAEESVLAHLLKLESEGRARRLDVEGSAAPAFEAIESAAE